MMTIRPRWLRPALAAVLLGAGLVVLPGCSVRRMAVDQLGSALAGGGGAFASEEDLAFAGQAVPFSLKLIESLLETSPENDDLLLAAASGFTQYAYAFVAQPADFREAGDLAGARAERIRARAFYLRAHAYALRGLEARHPGFTGQLEHDPAAAAARARRADVPLLYWAAVSLGGAISHGMTEPGLIARAPQVAALIDRAVALDESWGEGTLHEFLVTFEMARQGGTGRAEDRARRAFARALELSEGQRAGTFVGFAEAVAIPGQHRAEFEAVLARALALDLDAQPSIRLANRLFQDRARWLLARSGDLFLE